MDVTRMPGYVDGFHLTLSLRELGGWRVADGRCVRRGLLYRGAALVNLTDDERERVDALDLRFVLDLRATGECVGAADYVPNGTDYLRIAGMYVDGNEVDFSPAGIARMSRHIERDPEGFMSNLYASMMFDNPAVHTLVKRFVDGQAPLYFHCTAGKDRTGVCAAVLLMLLGVSDDDIVQEFLLTNEYRAEIIHNPPATAPEGFPDVSPEQWAQMNGVQEANLRSAFAAVDDRFRSREAYFFQEFGIDDTALAALRDHYLL